RLIARRKRATRPAPRSPPVHQHDPTLLDGLLEILHADRHCTHAPASSLVRCKASWERFSLLGRSAAAREIVGLDPRRIHAAGALGHGVEEVVERRRLALAEAERLDARYHEGLEIRRIHAPRRAFL